MPKRTTLLGLCWSRNWSTSAVHMENRVLAKTGMFFMSISLTIFPSLLGLCSVATMGTFSARLPATYIPGPRIRIYGLGQGLG